MDIKKAIAENGENLIGKWTINCIPFGSGRMLGKLYVTDKSFYYDAQYDMSLEGVLQNIATSAIAASGHALLVSPEICEQWKSKGFLQVNKSNIKSIGSKSSFFKKTVTVTLNDDQSIVFDYGMLSVKKLEAALKD